MLKFLISIRKNQVKDFPMLSLWIILASQYFLTVKAHREGLVDTIFWQQGRVMMMAIILIRSQNHSN